MPTNWVLDFADDYAAFKNQLEKSRPSELTTRGLTHALLAMIGDLRQGNQDAVDIITTAISVYRTWEEQEAREEAEYEAAEERRLAARKAAEERTRTARCPTCDARPGDACHRPNGRPAPESHRRRYRAARQEPAS
jgi:predicted RecB family endonuclease